MIRKFITPDQLTFTLNLELPEDYLGQELELILFKKLEGLVIEKKTSNIKLSDKYRGVFSKEDASSFTNHSQDIRNEWESI